MREILFRGKRKDNGEWVYGNSVLFFKETTKIYGELVQWREVEVIPETVGQYTGLTDKNGKKIFEGDIIAYGDDRYLVNFGDGYFSPFDFICEDECKVIGNIYDNPELLGE